MHGGVQERFDPVVPDLGRVAMMIPDGRAVKHASATMALGTRLQYQRWSWRWNWLLDKPSEVGKEETKLAKCW